MQGLDFLQQMMGGQQRNEYQDFVQRYDQGRPADGYSGQEVMQRYNQMAPQMPPQMYEDSAREAFERMSPEDRQAFSQWLVQRSREQGGPGFIDANRDGIDDRTQDPAVLARTMSRMQREEPDLLQKILGGQSGTALDNPMVKAALAGVAAMAAKRILTGR